MEWRSGNWLWISLIGAMFWIHRRHPRIPGAHFGHLGQARANSDSQQLSEVIS